MAMLGTNVDVFVHTFPTIKFEQEHTVGGNRTWVVSKWDLRHLHRILKLCIASGRRAVQDLSHAVRLMKLS